MSIRYGEDVFRSVELPLIRAMLDVLPMAAQHTSALHDVEDRFNQTVGAEAAGVFIQTACKKIWLSFAIQNDGANQKVWRDAIAENRLDDAITILKQQYDFTADQATCAVVSFQQFIPPRTPHG